MAHMMSDTDESLYRVSYILTENSQFQCPVCFEQFLHEDAVQCHMSQYNHYEATTVFIKSEKDESEEDMQTEEIADHVQEIDETLLNDKVQTQVIHALANIEKLSHQIVREEYAGDDSSSNQDIAGHLQVELKTEDIGQVLVNNSGINSTAAVHQSKSKPHVGAKRVKAAEYLCDLCQGKFPKRHLLKQHMKEHEDGLNYCCDICQKTFTFKQQLNTHRRCHTLERKYRCMTCDKSYKFKQQLNLHILTHSGIKPYTCETCQKSFTLERQLQSHLKVHTSIKPFVCAQCGKCFKIKQQLQNHELTHYDIKPFSCEVCSKSFKLKQQLQNHQKVHEDIKPYPCDRCTKSFKFKQQLQNHGKIHDGVKQFQCEFCEKDFMFKQQLQIHMKIHFGIKEFPCHLCPKDFRTKQQLQKHLEMHERRLQRLSDKSDDGMSEISIQSTTENDSEFGIDNLTNNNPNKSTEELPNVIVATGKNFLQQKFIILKRAAEVAKLLESDTGSVHVPVTNDVNEDSLEPKTECVEEERENGPEVLQEEVVVLSKPKMERSVIVETIETCMIQNRGNERDDLLSLKDDDSDADDYQIADNS